ncbi:MAG: GNAT family N-acetyltransferase [Xenococcaceae cyanobacterium MO_188.B29]|nr:GNAT family N-acetyltransferase [Xenococcaceae cyanobacterium MO_188.B29]
MNFKIRQAQSSESELISSLALRSKAYWNYSQEFILACRRELTYSQQDIQNNHFFVAEINNLIIGFFALEILSEREIELAALFIDPAYINQGYGRKLIARAKLIARELGSKVMIIQGDPNATNFYLKVGGKLIGERESASIPGRYLPVFLIKLYNLL